MSKTKINKNKQKKIFKKTKKNRQYSAGEIDRKKKEEKEVKKDEREEEKEEKEVKDEENEDSGSLKEKLTGMLSSTGEFVGEKALRLVGFKEEEEGKEKETGLISTVSEVGKDVVNVADKVSGAVIENVNEVLGSPKLNIGVTNALENTKDIIEDKMEILNKITNDPKFEKIAEKSIDKIAKYSDIAVDAMEKPLDKAIDKLNESGTKAISGALSGAVKVGTDVMAAVPGAGAIVEAGKIINDLSKATGSVVEAGTEAATTVSDLVKETSQAFKEGMKELENKKKEASDISDRTSKSIEQFVYPTIIKKEKNIKKGGTKRRLKYKGTKKRVRFAV
jgi:glycine cleavage system H lipoate-binding protein